MTSKMVVVLVGLPLSGKTTLGQALAKETGLHFIDIDGAPASCTLPQAADHLSTPQARQREQARMAVAYSVLHAAAEANLRQGLSVIIAATYSSHASQAFLKQAVEKAGGVMKLVWCQFKDTPVEIERRIRERLRNQAVGGVYSVAKYREVSERYEGIGLSHIVIRMDGGKDGVAAAVKQVLEYMEQ